jgi:hypothetical protein
VPSVMLIWDAAIRHSSCVFHHVHAGCLKSR